MAAGAEIIFVRVSLPVSSPRTIIPAGFLIAGAMIVCSLLLLFDPVQRSAYATAAILLAISALTTSHLGGYLLGTLLGGAGGATAFAWVPEMPPPAERPAQAGPPGFTLIRGDAEGVPGRPDRLDEAFRPDRSGRPRWPGHEDDGFRGDGADRPGRANRPERARPPDDPGRPGRGGSPEELFRRGRAGPPEEFFRPGPPGQPDDQFPAERPVRPVRPDRPDWPHWE
jgi:Family of unknown function (DUF6114)